LLAGLLGIDERGVRRCMRLVAGWPFLASTSTAAAPIRPRSLRALVVGWRFEASTSTALAVVGVLSASCARRRLAFRGIDEYGGRGGPFYNTSPGLLGIRLTALIMPLVDRGRFYPL
jgi:hypothetical protein